MNRILEQVQNGDFDPVQMFTGNKDKFLEVRTAIENISNNLTKETCIKFLISKIIPTAFDRNVNNAVRDEAIEIGFHFLKFVNISSLSTKEQENIFISIEETYAKTVGELRDNNYSNWDRLWIFLIRLCHEKLHSKMSLANKLLRVVEVAFRNSTSIEQRLKAYDCWIELIDNCSLNMDYMCSPKQIKLLMTPMKAKFSRMPVVIMKRCDTFVYLLEKLEDKVTLCLKEFLEFCFGPFEEKNDTEKMRQGKSVPDVCIKSTKILLEIIGHSHNNSERCVQSDDIHLRKVVINGQNFSDFAEILINSVVECCILLDEWNKDSLSIDSIIKCLWRSLLQLIRQANDETKQKCYSHINSSLNKLLERLENNKHHNIILENIIELLIKGNNEKFKEILLDVVMNLLKRVPINSCPFDEEEIFAFIDSCFASENVSAFAKIASSYFTNDSKCANSQALSYVWLKCNVTITPGNISNMIWPMHHLQKFKDLKALTCKWTKIYSTECKADAVKASIMQEMEKLFLENPLLSSNVTFFLQLIADAENNSSKDFVAKLMRLIEQVLTFPNLSNSDIKKISSITLTYCNQHKPFYKCESNDEIIETLCRCLEHLVTIHKDYTVLTELTARLNEGLQKNLIKFSKCLMSFLETLMLNEDNLVANSTRKLIELLETKENDESDSMPLVSTRSLRIINMVNITPKPTKLGGQINNLKLFGKNVPPIRGSKVDSTPKAKKLIENKKKNDILRLIDDKSSDYVKIDTEVKIDLNNLNEHQKEVLKKRREDIPALYQDLTQSLTETQDAFTNSSGIEIGESKENAADGAVATSAQNQDNGASVKRKREDDDDIDKSPRSKRIKHESLETSTARIEEIFTQSEDTKILDVTEETKTVELAELIEVDTSPEEIPEMGIIESDQSEAKKDVFNVQTKEEIEATKQKLRQNINQTKKKLQSVNKNESSTIQTPGSENITKKKETKSDEDLNQVALKGESEIIEESVIGNAEEEEKPSESTDGTNNIEEKVGEKPVRKSTRQVKRRLYIPERKKRKTRTIGVEQNETDSSLNQTDNELLENSLRKSKRHIKRGQKDESVNASEGDENAMKKPEEPSKDTFENLLVRVDKRTKKNKKVQEEKMRKSKRILNKDTAVRSEIDELLNVSLPDGNQNKIVFMNLSTSEEKTKKSRRSPKLSLKPRDVYEFTGDDDAIVENTKKSIKKKKKSTIYLSQNDYISKRRKKSKKETKEEGNVGFPFHVTADCSVPLPLSKSQSLRAVPSPQESETITIVITRSPPESENTTKEDKQNAQTSGGGGDSPDQIRSPRKYKRKSASPEVSPPTVNSEDVIESSQAVPDVSRRRSSRNKSPGDVVTPKASSNKRRTRSNLDMKNFSHKDLAVADTLTLETNVEKEAKEDDPIGTSKISTVAKSPKSRRLSLTETSTDTVKLVKRRERSKSLDRLNFDPEITFLTNELKQTMSFDDIREDLADTVTMDSQKLPDTLTLSPVENKTKDLPGSPVTCDTPDRTIELLNNTSDISPITSTQEVASTPPGKSSTNEVTNLRVARLLQMVNSNVPVNNTARKWFGNKHSSPSTSKVRKMRLKREENLDILTFSREVPSPLTVPASGILKRKFNNLDETATGTPSPKRKRVNFSDPAITDKKIFIKDLEEYEASNDFDQKTESTKESQNLSDVTEDERDKTTDKVNSSEKIFLSSMDREGIIVTIKEFCDSKLQDVDSNNFKNALKCLIQKLKVPEMAEIISDCLISFDSETMKDTNTLLVKNETTEQVIDKLIVPLIENLDVFDIFLPKLFTVLEKLSEDKLQYFIREFMNVFGENRINNIAKEELTRRQIEEHVVGEFDCDRMNELIKKYFFNLKDQKRNDFLVNLMNLASSELPVSKEFVNCHVNMLQDFVKRMTD